MSDLPSVKQKVQTESTRYRSAVSEFLVQTIGKSVNWLIDRVDALDAGLAGQNVSYVVGVFQQDTVGGTLSYTCPVGKNAHVTLNVWNNSNSALTFTMSTPQISSGTFALNAVASGRVFGSFGVHVGSGQTVTIGGATAGSGTPVVQIVGAQYETINLTVP